MVAKTVALPNLRKIFIPDPGYYICDCDLAQADAQIVAWEANDALLKEIFRDPDLDLHDENAKLIYGHTNKRNRQLAKGGVHAVNYGAKARTLARALGITVWEAEKFIKAWFRAHPGITDWHRRVEDSLATTRSVKNAFGNWRYYFGRIDTILPEALAWIPQSSVALIIDRGLVNIDEQLPQVELLMQVHDSVVMQYHQREHPSILKKIKKCLEIVVPYDDPLIIPTSADISLSSWGDAYPVDWEGKRKKK